MVIALLLVVGVKSFGQDTLYFKDIKSYHYTFQIDDGNLTGAGADFLKDNFKLHQVVMLGEFHGLKSISEFTTAIIPSLNENGFGHFGLEVGPTMGRLLDTISVRHTEGELRRLNQKYQVTFEEDVYTPIPFFESREDAAFLNAANSHGWNVFGVDQEYFDSYPLLFDLMFANLDDGQKAIYRDFYKVARDSIVSFYNRELYNDEDYIELIYESKIVHRYLDAMKVFEGNRSIVEAFLKSVEIYKYNNDRKWSLNYSTRMNYMKVCLKAEMDRTGFDFEKDKLLMKMGRLHLSKGISSYGYNEIGNTLTELTEFHGKSALGIGFETRYVIENDTIVDELDSDNKWVQNYAGFTQFGDKEHWVLLDLKGIRQDFYWYPSPLKSKLNAQLEKLIENYDILVIPPAYGEATANY